MKTSPKCHSYLFFQIILKCAVYMHVYGSKDLCDSCKIWLSIADDDCIVEALLQVTRPTWHWQYLLHQSPRNNVVESFMCLMVCVLPCLLCRQLNLHTPLHSAYESCLLHLHDRCVVWQATYLLMSGGVDQYQMTTTTLVMILNHDTIELRGSESY